MNKDSIVQQMEDLCTMMAYFEQPEAIENLPLGLYAKYLEAIATFADSLKPIYILAVTNGYHKGDDNDCFS